MTAPKTHFRISSVMSLQKVRMLILLVNMELEATSLLDDIETTVRLNKQDLSDILPILYRMESELLELGAEDEVTCGIRELKHD